MVSFMKKFAVMALFLSLLVCAAVPAAAAPAAKAGWPAQLKFMAGPPGGNWFALGSAFAAVFGRSTATPVTSSGAATMKMISSTSITSTIGVTLISAIGALRRRPRPPELTPIPTQEIPSSSRLISA